MASIDHMKPPPFEYHAPDTLDDALALLARYAGEDGRVLAGGQTLVPAMAMRLARPGHLIDINGVAGLDGLSLTADGLRIGATVRHAALHASVAPGALGRLLGLMQPHIAHRPIRARGTFCGSLANADAASEWCLLAVALGAQIELRSTRGGRVVEADAFFLGYMSTTLEPDEIVTAAILPALPHATSAGFYEFARRAGDFAQVSALATFRVAAGRIAEPRIAIGSLSARPHRIAEAERALAGQPPGPAAFAAAARAAAAALPLPEEDPYLRSLGETAVLRALTEAT
jgi:carbon-monoxide dehydrogenase medium subunit